MVALALPAAELQQQNQQDALPTGISSLDCPRGGLTEVCGLPSTGKTAFMLSTLAEATWRGECCALIDTNNTFDPHGAAQAGVELHNLVWIRANHDADAALKAVDLLLHGGGFGLVCLDLAGVAAGVLNRLPSSYWFRFRLVVENTPTVLFVLTPQPVVRSCARRSVECRQAGLEWSGRPHTPSQLLRGIQTEAVPRRPIQPPVLFRAKAV